MAWIEIRTGRSKVQGVSSAPRVVVDIGVDKPWRSVLVPGTQPGPCKREVNTTRRVSDKMDASRKEEGRVTDRPGAEQTEADLALGVKVRVQSLSPTSGGHRLDVRG